MTHYRYRLVWAAVLVSVVLALIFGPAPHLRAAFAAAAATFTLNGKSAYVRDAPDSGAAVTYSVFKGQVYDILGRTADSIWVQLGVAGATRGTWIATAFGTVSGSLAGVPVLAGVVAEATPAGPAPTAALGQGNPVASSQRLTITAISTYARGAPAWTATKVASLFKGQAYTVTGRDSSAQWLQVLLPAAAWVSAGVGTLSGNLWDLAVIGTPAAASDNLDIPAPTPQPGVLPPWIPALTPHMRQIYRSAAQHGRDPAVFSVAGDCNSEANIFTELIAFELIDLSSNPYLKPTARYFRDSTFHKSYAVAGGFSAAEVMNPLWSIPPFCGKDESPFDCELRTTKSSVVFILLGTGDHLQWQDFESNYRVPIEHALKAGVLPVLVTKVDSLEAQEAGAPEGAINSIIRRLGTEYDVPVIDLWLATRSLRDGGLTNEPGNDFHLNAEAIGVHVISTLQMLYRLQYG